MRIRQVAPYAQALFFRVFSLSIVCLILSVTSNAQRSRDTALSPLRVDIKHRGLAVRAWAGPQHDLLIAPKLGVGIPGLSIYYAYHFSANEWSVGRVGRHAVGIQVSPYLRHHNRLNGTKTWFWEGRKAQ